LLIIRGDTITAEAKWTLDKNHGLIDIINIGKLLMIELNSPVKLSRNESLKQSNAGLRGSIASTLHNPDLDRFSEDDYEFLKFHGIYQQDDRDLRKSGKKYIFMVRGRLPGGVVGASQYLDFDQLAKNYGNDSLRITSRQGFQLHGVVKSGLGPMIKGIHDTLATTLAACGDVNRNVMAPPTPSMSSVGAQVLEHAKLVSDALLPKLKAYHQIWVEGTRLDLTPDEEADIADPLYGRTYLPRKFKTAFAIPPLNDVDVFTNCLGFVAITDNEHLLGYDLLAGGGLGMSHGNSQTFPRLADVIGFISPDSIVDASKAVLSIHRDFGDRTNRKHARLKYVLEERGAAWFRAELENRLGFQLLPARPFELTRQGDLFGWHKQHDGRCFLGLFVQAGRISDVDDYKLKTGLREVVAKFEPEIRLTPSQNLLLANLDPGIVESVNSVLSRHGIQVEHQANPVRRASMACPALPTCGLALAESERFLPEFMTRVETILSEVGLPDLEIVVRITGCPNGCVRPYMAELGLVGKAPGRYQIYLGGNAASSRLNRLFQDSVKDPDLTGVLRPILERYARERMPEERFGDWCARVLWSESPSAAD
jgi:sulfite reductase (NADPH) hemoprotein beta-component